MAVRRIANKKTPTAKRTAPTRPATRQRSTVHRENLEAPSSPISNSPVSDIQSPESPATQAAIEQATSGIAVLPISSASLSNPPASAEKPPASAEKPPASAASNSSLVSTNEPASAEAPRILAPPTHYIQTGEKAPRLSSKPSRAEVQRICDVLMANGTPFRPVDVVARENDLSFTTLLKMKFATDPPRRDECNEWKTWSNQRFCRELKTSVPDNAISRNDKLGFVESISQVQISFDLKDPSVETKTDHQLSVIVEAFPDATPAMHLTAAKILIDKLPAEPVNWRAVLHRNLDMTPRLITVDDFRFVWMAQLNKLREAIDALKIVDVHPNYGDHSRQIKTLHRSVPETKFKKRPRSNEESAVPLICTGCGRGGHIVSTCRFRTSPFWNTTNKPFLESKGGREMLKKHPNATWIPRESSDSATSSSSAATPSTITTAEVKHPAKKQKGKLLFNLNPSSIAITPPVNTDSDLIPLFLSPVSQQLQPEKRFRVLTLLDTGSLAGNFVAFRVLDSFSLIPHIKKNSKKLCSVCSGLDNQCHDVSDTIDLTLSYFCLDLNKYSSFQISAYVLHKTPIDLIIGRKTIRDLNLFSIFPGQIQSKTALLAASPLTGAHASEQVVMTCCCQPKETLQPSAGTPKGYPLTQMDDLAVTQKHVILASLIQESEQLFGFVPADEDEIEDDKKDSFSPWINLFPDTDPLSLIHIAGDEVQQNKLRLLCNEFRDIFSNELPANPAKIPPFDINVDDKKWKVSRNRTPPRPQSTANQADIVRQLAMLEKQGIIEKSTAAFYSQVLMVSKHDGSKRMCIDFRNLNDCTEDASWPIPNIIEMLRRIGAHHAILFAVLDLTQGYHQVPLTLAARVYTAFILFCGVYQFTRLPFGPKRAPSFFQETMATVVLAGLIYVICEMYIDDCNVFAKDTDELVFRLRLIFERFRKHNIFLKPNKCFLGYSEIDYVGKVLSAEGLKMSQERIRQVLDFPKPDISKQLKSFLGLVNYFHDFIRNASSILQPLHRLLQNYNKTKKIVWTPEAEQAFDLIKSETAKCTTMHFLSDTDPIYLHTDASDYGVGAYLFQLVDGKETPIAFVSKSLNKAQLRWAVIQKEAYAIFYACTYLKSLLRDRLFTIRTDHRNLLYIKNHSNPMIIRWLMALSEFSFKIEFIPGVNNNIADSMSRLCRNNMIDFPQEYTPETIIAANIIEKFKLTREQHNAIGKLHNSKVGHFGLERTLKRLKDINNTWQFQRQHVRWFIDHCPCCQKMSMLKTPIHAHGFSTSTYTPMECLNIDFIGPFPDGGYVLVINDTFTRWVELYHTKDASALSTAQCLLKHFGRFGAPLQLRSDNGPHFIAEVIKEFLALIGTQHCLTLAYSKEENAIVERMNKEVNRHLRALTYDNVTLDDYSTSLPFVQRILNSNHSDRLKISAAELLFGNVLKLDRGIFLPPSERLPIDGKPLSKHMSDFLKMQDSLLKASAKELLRTDLLHQTQSQINQHVEYLPDSFVLVHYRDGSPPSRLHTHWRGPLKVVSGNNSRYTLYDLITQKSSVYHVSNMKPFLYDPAITDPLDVARRDHMEYFVEEILAHRGPHTRSHIEFLVKWLSYPDCENSWEPYSNLRDVDKLHVYLRRHNLQKLINKQHR